MNQHGHKARLTDRPESDGTEQPTAAGAQPSWMEMLDPEAREARIAEAQRRRAEALARRDPQGREARIAEARRIQAEALAGRAADGPTVPPRAPARGPVESRRTPGEEAEDLARILAARRLAASGQGVAPLEPPREERPAPRPPVERVARISDEERARRLAETRMAFVRAARAGEGMPVPRPRSEPEPEPVVEEDELIALVADPRPIPKARASRAPLVMIFFAGLCAGGVGVALALWWPERPARTASSVPAVEQFAPSELAEVPGGVAPVDGRPRLPDVSAEPGDVPVRLSAPVADSDPLATSGVAVPAPFLSPTPPAAVSGGLAASVPATEGARVAAVDPAAPVAPAPEAAVPAEAARPAAAPEAAVPATLAEARVFVHYPASAEAVADEAVAALSGAGAEAAKALPVGFSVGKTNVRYYHPEDRAAAEQVAALTADLTGAPLEARDFTDFRPSPNPGVIEVWLEGNAPAARRAAPVAAAPAQPQTGTRPVLASDQEAEEVHRLLLERSVERMLREKTGAN